MLIYPCLRVDNTGSGSQTCDMCRFFIFVAPKMLQPSSCDMRCLCASMASTYLHASCEPRHHDGRVSLLHLCCVLHTQPCLILFLCVCPVDFVGSGITLDSKYLVQEWGPTWLHQPMGTPWPIVGNPLPWQSRFSILI